MKKLTLLLALILCLSTCVLAFASCGKNVPDATTEAPATTAFATTDGATTDGATTPEETEPITEPGTTTVDRSLEIHALSTADRTFRFQLSGWSDPEKTSKNDKFIAGPDSIDESATPSIEKMVYKRNEAASELLNTTIRYDYWSDLGWGSQAGRINTLVQGNAADAPDLFVDMIYDLGLSTMNGVFKDIMSIPGSFFNFEAEGWMGDWMKSVSFTGDRAYTLAGDYFLDILRAMTVVPFNVTMMDANSDSLASAIIGDDDPLGAGENLSSRFFDFVEEGKWTWDALGKLSAAIWEDTDGDGADSIRDRLGFLGAAGTNMASSMYLYSNSEKLFDERENADQSDPNYGKPWIYYADMGGLGDIFDAVERLFAGQGTFGPDGSKAGNTPDDPGIAYHFIKFGQGEVLFAGACVLGAMEDDAFQQMVDLYSVVPVPKVHADGEYNTVIHNVGDAGAINVNTTPGKAKAVSAYLQYCTENSGGIRQEFLEIVTKYKTTVYNQGTDRMFDLIYDHTINGRDKAIEDIMGTDPTCKPLRWHVLLKDGNQFTHDSSFIASKYESAVAAKQAFLNQKLAEWYNLPKVEAGAE